MTFRPPLAERLHAWALREHAAWKQATRLDPFLPLTLLPAGYLGRAAWEARCEAFAALSGHHP